MTRPAKCNIGANVDSIHDILCRSSYMEKLLERDGGKLEKLLWSKLEDGRQEPYRFSGG